MKIKRLYKRSNIRSWSLTSSSSFFHKSDMSHIDLEHTGHVYLHKSSRKSTKSFNLCLSIMTSFIGCIKRLGELFYRLCSPISFVHSKCIVWPHRRTVISLVESNRYWEQIKPKSGHRYVAIRNGWVWFFYLKTNRAIVMHCAFDASVFVLHYLRVATSCSKETNLKSPNKEDASICRNKHTGFCFLRHLLQWKKFSSPPVLLNQHQEITYQQLVTKSQDFVFE